MLTLASKCFRPAEMQQEIHMVDLVSAVSFALRREVPKTAVVKGEAFQSLKGFVQVLLQVGTYICVMSNY